MTEEKYERLGSKYFNEDPSDAWMRFQNITKSGGLLKTTIELCEDFEVIYATQQLTKEQIDSLFYLYVIRYMIENRDIIRLMLL